MVILTFIYSVFVPILRGPINPQIIGYGHIQQDTQTNKYFVTVEYDTEFNNISSPKYFVSEYLSAVLPLFPVKLYIDEKDIGKMVTVFTADKLDGYHVAVTLEETATIKKAYNNLFLEAVSYHRGYYLFIMYFIGIIILISVPKNK